MPKGCAQTLISKIGSQRVIFFICTLNLFVMHYSIYCEGNIDAVLDIPSISENILAVVMDTAILYMFFSIVLWKKRRIALSATFYVTLLWSFANVLYSRFFHQYLSLSAIGQGGVLIDKQIMDCVIGILSWSDLYYPLCICLFWLFSKKTGTSILHMRSMLLSILIAVGVVIVSYVGFAMVMPGCRYAGFIIHRLQGHLLSTESYSWNPCTTIYYRGCIRSLLHEYVNSGKSIELSIEQQRDISKQIGVAKRSISGKQFVAPTNIIIVLVESLMSVVSDFTIDGKEVTPFLNSLKCDSSVYYNGRMHENVTIGESSDGQFIYMTGLLPLRSVITITKATEAMLPGLPKVLKRESIMVIPTVASIWAQGIMCQRYGFDSLYTCEDYHKEHELWLNDSQVFEIATERDKAAHRPFLSVILTSSMHQPYNKQIDPTFPVSDQDIPDDYACYLNACHYTDRQIEQYFKHLKHTGLYDNSLIVIAADHPVHSTDFGGVSKDIPLYIVNLPSEIKKKMWTGECNQLDVYTTLMDLLGIESDWYGLGQSLISPNYQSTIDSKKWDVSEWIIRGDYFNSVVASPSISHKP